MRGEVRRNALGTRCERLFLTDKTCLVHLQRCLQATELNLVNPNLAGTLQSQTECSAFNHTRHLHTAPHRSENKCRISMGEPLGCSRFVLQPLGLTVNPMTHSSQAPHSFQSTELSLFCLRMYLGLFYFKTQTLVQAPNPPLPSKL